MKKKRALRRVETKIDERPSIFVLAHVDPVIPGLFMVHGAFSTENKLVAELKRLGTLKENKLSRSQKLANTRAQKANKPKPHKDPMDRYTIREVTVQ